MTICEELEKSDLFSLAMSEIKREGKDPKNNLALALDKAFDLLHMLDVARRNSDNIKKRYNKSR